MEIGFSTGSLALNDVRRGLQMVAGKRTAAIELSALREEELAPLIAMLDALDLRQFEYVSFHAPSRLHTLPEAIVVDWLGAVAKRGWPIIVHPDVIDDFACWQVLGDKVCIENMDKRKPVGRSVRELEPFFERLPQARLCFDIGHARQVDPTMGEAAAIVRRFGHLIREIHMSFVASNSVHEPLNYESVLAFRRVAHLMPRDVPIILETPVTEDELEAEISKAAAIAKFFGDPAATQMTNGSVACGASLVGGDGVRS
jgi:hypothetical protein